jgi:transposase-like protein
MKLISVVNGRTNENQSEIRVPNEDDTTKQPVFGILCRNGTVWAEVVDDVEANTLQPLISQNVSTESIVCSDTGKAYTGIAARGYVHRLVNHGERQYSEGKGNHINGLEGFWGHLKRILASKGGIRREKLSLYLGEYIWRYNHRSDPEKDKIAENHSNVRKKLGAKLILYPNKLFEFDKGPVRDFILKCIAFRIGVFVWIVKGMTIGFNTDSVAAQG